jgi:hypothetical protein
MILHPPTLLFLSRCPSLHEPIPATCAGVGSYSKFTVLFGCSLCRPSSRDLKGINPCPGLARALTIRLTGFLLRSPVFHHNASVWRAIATAMAAEENAGRAFAPALRPDGLSVWIRKHAYVSTHARAGSVCRCLPVTLRLCRSMCRRARIKENYKWRLLDRSRSWK